MLREKIYPNVEKLLNKIASSLDQKGFSPNQLTLAGLGLNFVAGCIYATGHFFLGVIVLLIAALGDLLDGPLARVSKRTSKFGAFLDSTLDRYSDFFIFGGLALYFARHNHIGWFLAMMGIIVGAFVTSYAKARSENFIQRCSVGVFERAERITVVALGTLIPPLLPFAIWILLLGTNATAVQRILFVWKSLETPEDDGIDPI